MPTETPTTTETPDTVQPTGFDRGGVLSLFRLVQVTVVDQVTNPPAKTERRRSCRNAVGLGLLFFVLFQAGLSLAIRNDWLPVRDPVYHEKLTMLRQRPAFFDRSNGSQPSRLLALGSSRTQLAFDPAVAEEVLGQAGLEVDGFNFGCPAAGPMTSALYLRRLIDAGMQTDYLLVEIHPGFASEMTPPYESRWLHGYRLNSEEVNRLRSFGWDLQSPAHLGWKGWFSASYAYRFAILNHYSPRMLPCPFGLTLGAKGNPNGFVPGIGPPEHQRAKALERTFAEYAPTFENYQPGGPGIEAIKDILTLCQEKQIQAAIVLMPESSQYRAWYGETGFRAVGEQASELGEQFGVPVVDARDWVADESIADGHHLIADGAEAYSRRLSEKFLRGWLQPN